MSNRLFSSRFTKFWYSVPVAFSLEDWETWHAQTKKRYPVQYWLRETFGDFTYSLCRNYRDTKWYIYRLFKPCNASIRKAVPRQWKDISQMIEDVGFAMIVAFKKEADESCVDWNGTENHRKFKNWLDSAADWIAVARPKLVQQMENAYPPHPLPPELKGKTYDELYGEVNRLEKLIEDTDTSILKQMIEYRDYMWT